MNRRSFIHGMQASHWVISGALAVALVAPVRAQSGATDPSNAQGNWHTNVNGVAQSVNVRSSSNGVTVGIAVEARGRGLDTSSAKSANAIDEQPRGGRQFTAPGLSLSRGSIPGTSPNYVVPTGGSNIIVAGGPTSFENIGGQPLTAFGGFSIGGWTFDTADTEGLTTSFAPAGPVPHLYARSVALHAEQEFPLPPITLQVNPDPGRVNIDSWFWVDGYNGSILTHSKTEHASHTECRLLNGVPDCRSVDDSVTVVVHLTPKHYAWTFGDDRNNSAEFASNVGLGRAYTDPYPRDASPVAHAYQWSSISFLSQGGYPIGLTIDWSAEFSANGGGFQTIPDVAHTYEGRHQVRQIQSIVTR